ncbi:Centromere/kinetochore Zw10-domain-containing protein [Syncephalis pseudoplumigaleata]|uniref:Centromere/kinetochore Zw10-domain-containing protein n=1 Tax=Syncephalis pseudoplumigaleata TaxID=1712513 RepID=A0A4P9YY76_9FUNG|nr:Centromere/kinetochore Zw10-domain-containing protein [Syncephalis pseudoplumigaleata]|eukprot:RKP24502.1 Centromere/kinetochore Zw10-domain-containing protein [Syncephalis pseudoplumigaleata]
MNLGEELAPLAKDIQMLAALIHTRLQDFDQALLANELLSAVSCVHDTLSLINGLGSCNEPCDPEIITLLKVHLVDALAYGMLIMHCLPGGTRQEAQRPKGMSAPICIARHPQEKGGIGNAISLSDLFSALAGIEMLDGELTWIARQTIEHLIRPLLDDPSPHLAIERNRQQAVLTLHRAGDAENAVGHLDRLVMVAQFLARDILCGGAWAEDNESFTEPFADIWCHDLVRTLTQHYLYRMMPDDRSELQRYMVDMEHMAVFEKELHRLGLLPAHDHSLSDVLRQSELHYTERKRAKLLDEARAMLVHDEQNTVLIEDLYLTDRAATWSKQGDSAERRGRMHEQLDASLVGFPSCHQREQAHLRDLMAAMQGLCALDEEERMHQVEQALKQTIQHALSIAKSWRVLLPRQLYTQAMTALLHVMLEAMIEQTLAIDAPIIAPALHRLHRVLSMVNDAIRQCLPQPLPACTTAPADAPTLACIRFSQLCALLDPATSASTRQAMLADTAAGWSCSDQSTLHRLVHQL